MTNNNWQAGDPATMTGDHGVLKAGDAVWIGYVNRTAGVAELVTRYAPNGGRMEARERNVPLALLAPR